MAERQHPGNVWQPCQPEPLASFPLRSFALGHYITLTGTPHTRRAFTGSGLNGTLPSSMGNMVSLTTMCAGPLSRKHYTCIPPAGAQTVRAKVCGRVRSYLDMNQLTGTIPATIGNLINLTFMCAGPQQPAAAGPLHPCEQPT